MKNRLLVLGIAVVAAFLLGFIPQYVKAQRLESELRAAQQTNALAELRDLAALAYVQANQKNYGLATATASRLFNRARELANQASEANAKKNLESILAMRDKVTAELAKGDAAAIGDLQDVFIKIRQATVPTGEQ